MWFSRSETPGENSLRTASPNERRCITRESLDFYRALVIGGIYQFSEPVDVTSVSTYSYALRHCVDRHPHLSIIVAKAETETPNYEFCPRVDLSQHIQILERGDGNERRTIERVLPSILDTQWPPSIPAWKIVVLPFSQTRCFIGFSFSHSLGDGMTAMIFHRSFLAALQEPRLERDLICTPTLKQLSPPFDSAQTLPISWSFLLSPLLGEYLPESIASLFGLRASVSSITPGTWTGSSVFYSPETYRTGVHILSIDASTVGKTLRACRMHGVKMTGLIHQFIIAALSDLLPQPHKFDNLAFATAMNMRNAVDVSNDEMGLFVSGHFQTEPLQKPTLDAQEEYSWALAKSITETLAAKANELSDNTVGLLRYVKTMRSWTLSKLGHCRDGSYEVSNLLSFQPSGSVEKCSITEMVFCQPTNITSAPLTFNIVSTSGGPMNITVDWQVGALAMGSYEDEVDFVSSMCKHIESSFVRLTSTT
ncbi:hypothetical protein BP6252_04041 [Coleophoma cylindrospora]|uniref:Alcohol acetyltransferase n=1 Tax=Coleophoma cylindrospora TaxID=1849047 RepID=A0A3D8RZC7_9HELO|nr:hypothetical protein BP6252_04041 [Coleophoma cylindrospora]